MCGLRDQQTKRRLFTEKIVKISFQSAWQISRATEAAKTNVETIQNESQKEGQEETTHLVTKAQSTGH